MRTARPYRVVFTDPPSGEGARPRRGTVVADDLEVARQEAVAIAASGRSAEVLFVDPTGDRKVVDVYPPT